VIRTDLLNLAAEAFVASVFGEEFLDKARAQTDLAALVADPSESNCFMPFLLVSLPGNGVLMSLCYLSISSFVYFLSLLQMLSSYCDVILFYFDCLMHISFCRPISACRPACHQHEAAKLQGICYGL
jgi:hypothetical protein